MEPAQLEKWRNEVLSRLGALKVRARQIRQFMDAHDLHKLEDKADFEAAWQQIQDLFPEDLHPNRAGDLNRHIHFSERHDFSDIEEMDIPAVMESVQRYGRTGDCIHCRRTRAPELQFIRVGHDPSADKGRLRRPHCRTQIS